MDDKGKAGNTREWDGHNFHPKRGQKENKRPIILKYSSCRGEKLASGRRHQKIILDDREVLDWCCAQTGNSKISLPCLFREEKGQRVAQQRKRRGTWGETATINERKKREGSEDPENEEGRIILWVDRRPRVCLAKGEHRALVSTWRGGGVLGSPGVNRSSI